MKKYIIFDLWYTLIYLDEGWKTFNFLKEEFKIPRNDWIRDVKQLFLCNEYNDEKSFMRDFVKVTGINLDVDNYANILRNQKEYDLKHIKMYSDVMPSLAKIKASGYDIGILSNQCTFYESWFYDSILSKQTDITLFSHKTGVRKPNPEIYKMFADKAKVDLRDCLMIGDSIEQDVMTPMQLGMSAVYLDRKGESSQSIMTLDEAIRQIL